MFTLNALPNWMTMMQIAITPLIAVLIWIDEPAYGYRWPWLFTPLPASQITLMDTWRDG